MIVSDMVHVQCEFRLCSLDSKLKALNALYILQLLTQLVGMDIK